MKKMNKEQKKKISELDIISAREVAEIVGYSGFNPINNAWFYLDSKNQTRTNTSAGTSNYAWLFDNLGWNDSDGTCVNYGCNYSDTTNSLGYWTKTPYGNAGAGSNVWYVNRHGNLFSSLASITVNGVRPVITISKSLFN